MPARFLKRRRQLLIVAGLLCAGPALHAQPVWPAIPALSTLLAGRTLLSGRVAIEIPKLADNGNSVPLTVIVDSPMSERDRVVAIHLFSERNPRPRMASVAFGPDVGRALLATRVRLAGTQHIVAVAEMADGALWGAVTEVIVTQSACVDDI